MANVQSAKKRNRQCITRTQRNSHYRSMIRNQRKKLLSLLSDNKKADAETQLRALTALIQKVAGKGIVHKNLASNWVSSLQKRVAATKS